MTHEETRLTIALSNAEADRDMYRRRAEEAESKLRHVESERDDARREVDFLLHERPTDAPHSPEEAARMLLGLGPDDEETETLDRVRELKTKAHAFYTRSQFAVAVDEAHRCLHEAEDSDDQESADFLVRRAHEALHNVGAGQERIVCGTIDPEAQAIYADLRALRTREIPCGHTVADLIGGTERGPDGKERPSITKCGACLAIRQPEIVAARKAKGERTPETVLRAMLASYEAAAIAARLQRNVASALAISDERNGNFRGADAAVRKADAAVRKADAATNHLRNVLAWHLCGYSIAGFVAGSFGGDYEARLRGERPLDAPPLEEQPTC